MQGNLGQGKECEKHRLKEMHDRWPFMSVLYFAESLSIKSILDGPLTTRETRNILLQYIRRWDRYWWAALIMILRNIYIPNDAFEHTTRENKGSYGADPFCPFLPGVLHGAHFSSRHGDSYSMKKTSIPAYFSEIISKYRHVNDHKELWI